MNKEKPFPFSCRNIGLTSNNEYKRMFVEDILEEKPLNKKIIHRKGLYPYVYVEELAHKIDRILIKWKDKCKRLEIMSGDVGYFELKAIIESEIGDLKQEKTKAIILDNNELSLSKYQEEFGDLK